MEQVKPKPPFTPIGEELKQIVRKRKTGKARFRFPISAENAYQLIGASYFSEVERRGVECNFDRFTARNVENLANFITAENPKTGVILTGKVGNGKTTLMRAFNVAAQQLADMGYLKPHDWGYAHKIDFGLAIHSAKSLVQTAASDWARFEQIMHSPLLGLDELGEEPKEILQYGNPLRPIVDLLEYRYDRQLFTFITSNLDPDEISEKYGSRIYDRFREMLHIIPFGDQPSYRR